MGKHVLVTALDSYNFMINIADQQGVGYICCGGSYHHASGGEPHPSQQISADSVVVVHSKEIRELLE